MSFFRKLSIFVVLAISLSVMFVPVQAQASGGVLNIYSSRHYGAIEAAFDQFTADTGIQIRVSQGSPLDLLERLRAEGEYTPADMFLSIDAGTMMLAKEEGLLQAIDTSIVDGQLDASQYDADGYWFALSQRVRAYMYNPETVDPAVLVDYASAGLPQFNGRLCLRPGAHIYTISLVSSLIYHLGEEQAEAVVASWVANNPTYINSDTRIIETIEAGGCDLGITNHYYLARKLAETPAYPVQIAFPNQGEEGVGVFYNVNIVGITAGAVNVENAQRFIEYFSTVEGQSGAPEGFPGSNTEYPSNFAAPLGDIIAGFGEVKIDYSYPLADYGAYQQAAIDLINRTGYGLEETVQ
jgi:iron(III) transport system substrate-binding protein